MNTASIELVLGDVDYLQLSAAERTNSRLFIDDRRSSNWGYVVVEEDVDVSNISGALEQFIRLVAELGIAQLDSQMRVLRLVLFFETANCTVAVDDIAVALAARHKMSLEICLYPAS